jgi:hypothetical protein
VTKPNFFGSRDEGAEFAFFWQRAQKMTILRPARACSPACDLMDSQNMKAHDICDNHDAINRQLPSWAIEKAGG